MIDATPNWLALVIARIRRNLSFSAISEAQREAVIAEYAKQMQEETEAGRPFGAKVARDLPKPGKEDPITVRGERLSDLRARARAEHEPWRTIEREK
jgi:hypothetical protein